MKAETEEVLSCFAGFPFAPPCIEAEIQRAESILGEPLPPPLRLLYLAFNGFQGPTGAAFFWPLFSVGQSGTGLVEFNQFLRHGDEFPHQLVSGAIFFGDNGCGPLWGIIRDVPESVICWDPHDGDQYEVAGHSCLEVWLSEKRFYDTIAKTHNA
jgi:hypothetical protein